MYVVATLDPVVAIRAAARAEREATLPVRIGRMVMQAWLRRVERRLERAVRDLELKERQRAARPFRALTADLAGVLAGATRQEFVWVDHTSSPGRRQVIPAGVTVSDDRQCRPG